MNNKVFAYCRVSSKEQKLDRQIDAINQYCKNNNLEINERDIYLDKSTGKDFDRDEYKALKRTLRSGDTLIVKELDRLGRNKEAIKEELKWFKNNEIIVRILDIPTTLINFNNYNDEMATSMMSMVNNVLIEVLSTIAEQERNKIKKRQKEGIQAYRDRNGGKGFGRPKIQTPDKFEEVYDRWKNKEITGVKAMKELNLKKTTFYNLIKNYECK